MMLRYAAQQEPKRWPLGRLFGVLFPADMPLSWRASLVAAFLVQIVLAVKSVWMFHDQLNPDGLAYIRIAQYYLSGQTDLMVSGVWSPLLSWLIVPWLLVFDDPLLAAHAAVAVSAVVFLFGAFCVLRAVRLPGTVVIIGTWITAFIGVAWSGAVITPDLLMAGLFCCGSSLLMSDKWVANARTALLAGSVLGATYLAKAVALPASALLIIALPRMAGAASSLVTGFAVRSAIVAGLPFKGVILPTSGGSSFRGVGPHPAARPRRTTVIRLLTIGAILPARRSGQTTQGKDDAGR